LFAGLILRQDLVEKEVSSGSFISELSAYAISNTGVHPRDEIYITSPAESDNSALLQDFAYKVHTKRLKLALANAKPSQDQTAPSPKSSSKGERTGTTALKPRNKRTASTLSKSHFNIPESDFAKILTCVSCGARWTSRKTATQKLLHMKTCAKKQGLTEDTIQGLLHREIDKQDPGATNTGISKPHAENASAPRTYLEEVISVTTSAAKKNRSRAALPTIKDIAEAQDEIMRRAGSILGAQPSSSTAPGTRVFGSSKLALLLKPNEEPPPTTQPFQKSSLAGLIQRSRIPRSDGTATKRSLFYEEGVHEDDVDTNDHTPPLDVNDVAQLVCP
jgi:hypothetical protein